MDAMSQFNLHPDMAELVAAKQAVPTEAASNAQRNSWDSYDAALRRPYPDGMVVRDMKLPRVGWDIPVRIYRPKAARKASPIAVYIHGGADYRLAPEHAFPTGVEDCYAAISYLAQHGGELGGDPARIGLWGDSAGGNMAASCCLMARDRKGPKIAAQVLIYPCLTDELTLPAYETYRDSPVTTAGMDKAWDLYLGKRRPIDDPYAVPLKAKNLSHLPPAHIHVAEVDCLADDGRLYAQRLKKAGTPVVFRVAERMIHGFTRARFSGPAAAAEFQAPCDFLKTYLFA
ncbi:MAG: alpha/beta hydrolase [Alphaproteobacteria bacterium]|nr:alpha/beta hydrolase [Alphaproteobacteria bacterium]